MREVLVNFRLIGDEAYALRTWAGEEFRKPADQVRWLLRRELEAAGYLQPDSQQSVKTTEADNAKQTTPTG